MKNREALYHHLLELDAAIDAALAADDRRRFLELGMIFVGMEKAIEVGFGAEGRMLMRQVRAERKRQAQQAIN